MNGVEEIEKAELVVALRDGEVRVVKDRDGRHTPRSAADLIAEAVEKCDGEQALESLLDLEAAVRARLPREKRLDEMDKILHRADLVRRDGDGGLVPTNLGRVVAELWRRVGRERTTGGG